MPPDTSSTSTLSLLKRRQGSANASRNLIAPLAPAVFSLKVGLPRGSLSLSMTVNFEEEEDDVAEEGEGEGSAVPLSSSEEARTTEEEEEERRCCCCWWWWWRWSDGRMTDRPIASGICTLGFAARAREAPAPMLRAVRGGIITVTSEGELENTRKKQEAMRTGGAGIELGQEK